MTKITYFLFGTAACRLYNDGAINEIEYSDGQIFKFVHGQTSPEDLVAACMGWGHYEIIREVDFDVLCLKGLHNK